MQICTGHLLEFYNVLLMVMENYYIYVGDTFERTAL